MTFSKYFGDLQKDDEPLFPIEYFKVKCSGDKKVGIPLI